MITKTTSFILAAGFMLVTTLPAQAGFNQHGSHGRMHQQNNHIQHGIRSGRITPYEYARIKRQQNKIRFLKREFKSDGVLTKRERRILSKKKRRLAQSIRTYQSNDNFRHRYRNRHPHRSSDGYNQMWFSSDKWWLHGRY